MKTQTTTVFLRSGHALLFETYLDQHGYPKVVTHHGRGDLPSTCFSAEEGDIWIKPADIVAIQYATITHHPISTPLGH